MDKCKSRALLDEKGLKVTRQRIAILDIAIMKESVFSAHDIYHDLGGETDLATVYRNLQYFCEENLLREVINKDDRQYFELACVHNPVHPHFYCNSCKNIYCLKEMKISSRGKLSPGKKFKIQETILQFSGICSSCAAD
ncbi:MAG TPA: transcriptional repressor [Spirochaetota bacterium]|nr:transcriptional repressor [Spirochaetota bacterium]